MLPPCVQPDHRFGPSFTFNQRIHRQRKRMYALLQQGAVERGEHSPRDLRFLRLISVRFILSDDAGRTPSKYTFNASALRHRPSSLRQDVHREGAGGAGMNAPKLTGLGCKS